MAVPAGHDEWPCHRTHQEMVQGGVGEHDPEVAMALGHRLGDRAVVTFPQEDNGSSGGSKEAGLNRADLAETPRCLQIRDHDGEGFGLPVLPPAQCAHDGILECVAGQVVAPEPLDRDDVPRPQPGSYESQASSTAMQCPWGSVRHSRGPQAGQAVAWAWKRRLPGSVYSLQQAGHMANPASVVRSRS